MKCEMRSLKLSICVKSFWGKGIKPNRKQPNNTTKKIRKTLTSTLITRLKSQIRRDAGTGVKTYEKKIDGYVRLSVVYTDLVVR